MNLRVIIRIESEATPRGENLNESNPPAVCRCTGIPIAWVPAALSQIPRDPTPVVAKTSPEDVAIGKKLYEATCSKCHGLDGGGSDGPSLQGAPERLGDDAVGSIIRGGFQARE